MSIDPKNLPEGTVVERTGDDYNSPKVGYILGHGMYSTSRDAVAALPADRYRVARVFVPVPDGMSPTDAERILAEHVEWVPLLEDTMPMGARIREEYVNGEGAPTVYIHPDDVPQDPDAELIEAVAVELHNLKHEMARDWGKRPEGAKGVWRDEARRFLAVVREHEAGTR